MTKDSFPSFLFCRNKKPLFPKQESEQRSYLSEYQILFIHPKFFRLESCFIDKVKMNKAEMKSRRNTPLCYCLPFFLSIFIRLTELISYLVVDVFSIHFIVRVFLFLMKVFRSRKSVFVQQLTSILSHLVRLAFASLFEAFYMTVILFGQCIIFEAVSLHSMMFQIHFGNTSSALFASALTVCVQFRSVDIKKYRNNKEIVR